MVSPSQKYRLVKHAAHYGDATKKNGGGHDLDEWDIAAESLNQAKAIVLLQGAEFHHGYVDKDGAQRWVFSRLAPFSAERCERCPATKECPPNLVSGRHVYAPLDDSCIHCQGKLPKRERA